MTRDGVNCELFMRQFCMNLYFASTRYPTITCILEEARHYIRKRMNLVQYMFFKLYASRQTVAPWKDAAFVTEN